MPLFRVTLTFTDDPRRVPLGEYRKALPDEARKAAQIKYRGVLDKLECGKERYEVKQVSSR
jgi:hypothetical protein